ncbi:MAG: DUF4191 domain-containing protein [Propionibacteriaceae bacterium]|nr:DUF4191 domain-containing protein [Propionibacteriaceae bacterium]
MASERAKELAAKQKAELKAAKLAKKNSTNPKDWGWFKQIKETFKVTTQTDPQAKWWMLGAGLAAFAVFAVLSIFLTPFWVWLGFGVAFGVLAALYMLVFKAKQATYKRYETTPGAAEIALGMLNTKAWTHTSPITANKQMDVIHRAVGKPGIVLIGEGSLARLKPMLTSEQKKHEQVAYGVPVTTVIMGDQPGQVPLRKLASYLNKLPKAVRPLQVNEANQRLRALDAARPKLPVPKGPMAMPKGVNKALRGR